MKRIQQTLINLRFDIVRAVSEALHSSVPKDSEKQTDLVIAITDRVLSNDKIMDQWRKNYPDFSTTEEVSP